MNLPKLFQKSDVLPNDKSDSTLKEALVPSDLEKSSDYQEIPIGQVLPLVDPKTIPISEAGTRSASLTSLPYPPNTQLQYGPYGPINYTIDGLNPALHDPNRPLSYHEFFLAGLPGCWRPVTGMLGLAAGMMIVAPLFCYAVFAFLYNMVGSSFDALEQFEGDLENMTPGFLAYMNLALAAAIPITWFLVQELHGIRYGWVSSVKSKLRWVWLRDCLGLSVIALLATIMVSVIVSTFVDEGSSSNSDKIPTPSDPNDTTTRDFIIVILLLTPLQAAGEEYAFRGYLTQAFGGLCSRRWAAVLIPAVLFAMAHGSQDAPVFLDRFAFGVVTGLLVIMTGGLEAGIAMHVLNNLLAFGSALTMNDMSSAFKQETVSWWRLTVTMTQSLVYFGLVMMVARKRGIETTVAKSEVQGQSAQMPAFYPVPLPL